MFVARSAESTATSSASVHCLRNDWCGWRPRATSSPTVIPSGAIELCGSRPRRLAICLVFIVEMSLPSRSTVPFAGGSNRARARSSVDFPHALGPTMTVN
ncbi:Uncharacterised protein [Mycobacteroides abscessus subsp. abscessus]|nr:Uncharacterised protein [Mycobacteroides abscessus subsp. abscessus]